MNNDTFKNAFDDSLGVNFNIEATNNIGKIINTHYNIYRKIYQKNLDSTQNKFQKNNEKRQIILKNSSHVNVLLTFFHYNNTNNSWNNRLVLWRKYVQFYAYKTRILGNISKNI